MKLLITGGCGFIGSNFVNYVMQGHPDWDVVVLDSLTYAGRLENIKQEHRNSRHFKFVKSDIRDRESIESALEGVDAVVHFAAESHVAYSFVHADLFVDVNVRGTSVLCESIIKHSIKKFILISTSEVYGDCLMAPMSEEHPLYPKSPYAGSKAAADRLAYSYHTAFNMPLLIIRPFNNYGPSQHVEKMIPNFITKAIGNEMIVIHDDGSQTRDWLYVEDHVRAIEGAICLDAEVMDGRVVNVGTGNEVSVLSIAKMILKYFGKDEKHLVVNQYSRPGQVMRHVSSTDKAQTILDWKSSVPIEEGIVKTIEWYKGNVEWCNRLKYSSEQAVGGSSI